MELGAWVEEVNAFATERKAERKASGIGRMEMSGQQVRVLVRAVYNGPDHKSIGWHNKGEVIFVASGEYLQSLLRSGFVTMEIEPPVVPRADEPSATAASRRLAGEHGVNLRNVYGTGKDGTIVVADINRYLESLAAGAQENDSK